MPQGAMVRIWVASLHQDKTPRDVSSWVFFFYCNPQSNPLSAENYAKINKKGCHASRSHGSLFVTLSPRHCKASPGTAPRWVRRSAGSQPIAERPLGSAPRPFLLHAGRHFEWRTTCSAAGLRWGYRSPSVRLPAGPPAHRSEPHIRREHGNSLSSG